MICKYSDRGAGRMMEGRSLSPSFDRPQVEDDLAANAALQQGIRGILHLQPIPAPSDLRIELSARHQVHQVRELRFRVWGCFRLVDVRSSRLRECELRLRLRSTHVNDYFFFLR